MVMDRSAIRKDEKPMDEPLTRRRFTEAVVRNCAPTLLGAKPASLFTLPGCFRAEDEACRPCRMARERRQALRRFVNEACDELASAGVVVKVLSCRTYGALVYVYRPDELARHLSDARIVRALADDGYPLGARRQEAGFPTPACRPGTACRMPEGRAGACRHVREPDLAALIGALEERLALGGIPHEIGFFLGYPYEDVSGFIKYRGQACICLGAWKVYANARQAQRRFSRFKRCTRRCCALYQRGASLSDLAGPQQLVSLSRASGA